MFSSVYIIFAHILMFVNLYSNKIRFCRPPPGTLRVRGRHGKRGPAHAAHAAHDARAAVRKGCPASAAKFRRSTKISNGLQIFGGLVLGWTKMEFCK